MLGPLRGLRILPPYAARFRNARKFAALCRETRHRAATCRDFPHSAAAHSLVLNPPNTEETKMTATIRIDLRLHADDPAAAALRALPQRERSNALRLLLRRHFGDLPGLIGFREASTTPTGTPAVEPKPPAEAPAVMESSQAKSALLAALDAMRKRGTAAAVMLATLAAFAFAPMHEARADGWRLDANLASVHTERWARDSLNQRNPGVGVTWQASRTWALAGGIYTNSYRKPTVYALAEFTPLHIGGANHWRLDVGVAAGIATGYTRAEIPCAPLAGAALIRVTTPDNIALNIIGVPNAGAYRSGFIGFQLSVPLTDARNR